MRQSSPSAWRRAYVLIVVVSHRSTQVLCWALTPLTMGFVDAGEFTFIGRYVTSA